MFPIYGTGDRYLNFPNVSNMALSQSRGKCSSSPTIMWMQKQLLVFRELCYMRYFIPEYHQASSSKKALKQHLGCNLFPISNAFEQPGQQRSSDKSSRKYFSGTNPSIFRGELFHGKSKEIISHSNYWKSIIIILWKRKKDHI